MGQCRVINGRIVGLRSRSARRREHEQARHSSGSEKNFAHVTPIDRHVVARVDGVKTYERHLSCCAIYFVIGTERPREQGDG